MTGRSVLSGRSVLFSEMRQVVVGLAAAAPEYGAGVLIGTAVVGWPGRVWEICVASRGGSRVRYGIEITSLADYADSRVAVHLARAAEVAGWEGLFMWDHLAFAWGVAFGVAVPGICVDQLLERRYSMSAEENKKMVALTLFEGFNIRDLSRWSQKLSDDYAGEYPGVPVLNKTQSIGYNKRFVIAFPDTHFEVHSVVAQGDQVFIHWTASGTQTERLATVTGRTIPPTRRRATVSGVLLTKVRDGKIVRERWYWDQLSLLNQLGIMEHPGLFISPEDFWVSEDA